MESEEGVEMNAHVASLDIYPENDTQQQMEMDQHDHKSHEEIINTVTKEFKALDPHKTDMFTSCIIFVSEYQSDEETLEDDTIKSENTTFADAVSDLDDCIAEGMNSLSNTQELYVIFGQSANKTAFHDESPIEGGNALDPHIASGIAKMPDNIIDLIDSDSEEEESVAVIDAGTSSAKKDDSEEAMLLHPLDKLLQLDNSKFHQDDERLLKAMSLAIQNGAPANMVT